MSNNLYDRVLELKIKNFSNRAIARELNMPESTIRNWLKREPQKIAEYFPDTKEEKSNTVPLSESAIPKLHDGSREEIVEDIRRLAIANPEKVIGRNYYRVHGKYAESAWSQYFGTWHEAKRQSGIVLTRQQHNIEKQIAKHASVDHYRALNSDRKDYGSKYDKPLNSNRYKQVIIASDFHDKNVDTFFLKVFLDTCSRVKPDIIVLNGDIFDLPEFGRYVVDPRTWDAVGRIKFVHSEILGPLRNACPDSQIDFIEGNHENRLMRHMADATPALKAVLSDLHGMTISSLLGLDKYGINYIAKANLAAYNLSDTHKEVAKNYKIYYDSFICHHFPEGSSLGFPGVNGHHHKTTVTPKYNEQFGSYNWIQAAAGHKLDAEYCHAKWQLGFVIATVDTKKRTTVFDVVTFTETMAVVGGKVYIR